jgi:hypothetical protein
MNIAVFDLETNGLRGASVLSASSVVFDDGGVILDVFNRFYFPMEPFDAYTAGIHGLTLERLSELRRHSDAPLYFVEDWPDLLDFWEGWEVEGVVVHNLAFDVSFLPEIAQGARTWWCSMKGLTAYCAIPKRPGNARFGDVKYKWPKLAEAADIVCNGPSALTPSRATLRAEEMMGDGCPHVSLFDCFELYRVVSRIVKHRGDLLNFEPFSAQFYPPRGPLWPPSVAPRGDSFTKELLAYEQKLRSIVQCAII